VGEEWADVDAFFCAEWKIKRIFAKSNWTKPRQTKQQNVEQKQNTTENIN